MCTLHGPSGLEKARVPLAPRDYTPYLEEEERLGREKERQALCVLERGGASRDVLKMSGGAELCGAH